MLLLLLLHDQHVLLLQVLLVVVACCCTRKLVVGGGVGGLRAYWRWSRQRGSSAEQGQCQAAGDVCAAATQVPEPQATGLRVAEGGPDLSITLSRKPPIRSQEGWAGA
jgi:hypothetical protein